MHIAEGDITAAYYAATTAFPGEAQSPFIFRGRLWVAVNLLDGQAKAYRLTLLAEFGGQPVTFGVKNQDGQAARSDPNGFYHGVLAKYHGAWHALDGPRSFLVPCQEVQPSLFGDLAR